MEIHARRDYRGPYKPRLYNLTLFGTQLGWGAGWNRGMRG